MTVRRRAIGGGPTEVMKVKTKREPLTGTRFYVFYKKMKLKRAKRLLKSGERKLQGL